MKWPVLVKSPRSHAANDGEGRTGQSGSRRYALLVCGHFFGDEAKLGRAFGHERPGGAVGGRASECARRDAPMSAAVMSVAAGQRHVRHGQARRARNPWFRSRLLRRFRQPMRDRAGTARAPRRACQALSRRRTAGLRRAIRLACAPVRRGPSGCSPAYQQAASRAISSAQNDGEAARPAIAKGCAARRMRRACGFRERKRGASWAERDKRSGSGEALHRRNWCTARGASSTALDTGIARRRPGLRPPTTSGQALAARPSSPSSIPRARPLLSQKKRQPIA